MAKKIGVLTSGGDAPGMNAAVRAVCRAGLAKGMEVVGILRGYNGLLNGEVIEMNARTVSGIIQRGGTCLYTARCPEFRDIEGVKKGRDKCLELGLDGIVVIGGDGSFRGAADLSAQGIPCIGLPGTIDNDISCTEYTIGYDTAMNTAMEMIDKIRDTAQSHDRCSVVEVMGRNAGYIAINVGAAVGIMGFPDEYKTMVGERGVTLSGGQKQRSSIARALLKDSPVLILDDSLSAVDTDTEEKILENLVEIRKGKTTIVIAHRISTLQKADNVAVLLDGVIAEYGTPDELLKLGGFYSDISHKQQLENELG